MVALARPHALFLFDLGYFNLAACAQSAAAQAYFLSRLNPQTTLREVGDGREQPLDLARRLTPEPRVLLEKPVRLGAREQVAARLIAVRMPEALVHARRRQARAAAKKKGYTPSQAPLTLLAWNLFIPNVPATGWAAQTVGTVYALRGPGELVFKAWRSDLPLATLTTTTKTSTRCSL